MLRSLVRLQLLGFRRAPHFGGRLVLAVLKGFGLTYAVLTAAALGFLLPDTLSVWAPGVSALAVVSDAVVPALGLLTLGRVLFQDVPARGAEAFLLLPVARRRVARAVTVRAALTVFNAAPLAFAVPFALRTVRADLGLSAAAVFVASVAALVAVSHVAVVVWKTRLGAAPVETVAAVGAALVGASAVTIVLGGPLGHRAPLVAGLVAALAAAFGAYAHLGVVEALYLDTGAGRRPRAARRSTAGFGHTGVRAFLDLERRLVVRARYPRGIVLNGVVTSVALAVYAIGWGEGIPARIGLVFSAAAVAVSAGQFALPFASGHYDRLLTLPGAPASFVRAKLGMAVGSVVALGGVQMLVALALAPEAWAPVIGASLFGAGVLAPAAVLGSTLAPKPLDVADSFMTSSRVQSLPPQVVLAAAGGIAGALFVALGPHLGLAAVAAVGAAGALGLPLWASLIEARLGRRRYAVAARFRSVL